MSYDRMEKAERELVEEVERLLAEAKARAKAAEEQKQFEEKKAKHEERGGRGRAPRPPSETVAPKAWRNFTDPDSRIMKHGATKSFEQCYNTQAAVDAKNDEKRFALDFSGYLAG